MTVFNKLQVRVDNFPSRNLHSPQNGVRVNVIFTSPASPNRSLDLTVVSLTGIREIRPSRKLTGSNRRPQSRKQNICITKFTFFSVLDRLNDCELTLIMFEDGRPWSRVSSISSRVSCFLLPGNRLAVQNRSFGAQ